jgi:hypothetical protein
MKITVMPQWMPWFGKKMAMPIFGFYGVVPGVIMENTVVLVFEMGKNQTFVSMG